MGIAIKNAEEFRRLLEALANEVVDACIFWRLHRELQIAAQTFHTEFAQARGFWGLTVQAHLDAAVFRLCKIYDQHKDGLNLKTWLETIQANRHVFSEANFRERLKDNPFVESLAQDARMPDGAQLQADLQFVDQASNPTVKTLVNLRNKAFAHRASREVVTAADLSTEYPLTYADVTKLLERAMEIVNRYSSMFNAQTYSTQMIGHDDYKTVINALHADMQQREEEIQRTQIRLALHEAWEQVAAQQREETERSRQRQD